MPTYGYLCQRCGPFEAFRSMDRYADPLECPGCGASAPRAMLTAPGLAMMDSASRTAQQTNERSKYAPLLSTLAERKAGHGAGCACCHGGKSKRRTARGPDGAKSFPAARPWMISH